MVGPAAERLRRQFLADGDERAMELATLLDQMRGNAHAGWAGGEGAAMQLVRLISSWTTS
jgi:hypothetical protein